MDNSVERLFKISLKIFRNSTTTVTIKNSIKGTLLFSLS